MYQRARFMTHAAILAALYAVMTHMQNLMLPGTASFAIQLRLSEMLMVLCFFTPAAAPGLAIGCLIFNLTFGAALPLDPIAGSLATYLAGRCMYRLGKKPLLGLMMPALWNGLMVGGELALYMGGGFWMNAVYVAIGEGIVLYSFGAVLFRSLKKRGLHRQLFG